MTRDWRRGTGKARPIFPQNVANKLFDAGVGVLGRYIDRRVNACLVKFLGPTRNKFTEWKQRKRGSK